MTKEEIAGVLEQIATLLELKAENPFKIRAYTNAARAIETFGANVSNFQDEEAVAKIPGIGKSIALKIKELAETGSLNYFRELSAEFPPGILELFSLARARREKDQGTPRQARSQFDRAVAKGMRRGAGRGVGGLWRNNTAKDL